MNNFGNKLDKNIINDKYKNDMSNYSLFKKHVLTIISTIKHDTNTSSKVKKGK